VFKEILYYTFRQPFRAFDISGFHQHGTPSGVGSSGDGAATGSGAMVFNGQSSRVQVPFGEVWQELGAIKVEALVRINQHGVRHNLVEGLLSFALFVRSDGVATGSFLAPEKPGGPPFSASNTLAGTVLGGGGSPDPFSTLTATPPDSEEPEVELAWIGVNTDTEFAPDGIKRTVAPGVWTRVTFIQNGFSLQLWLNDELAGYRDDITAGVLGVQPGGVHIGAWPNADNFVLDGALDEIRIWKLDPFYRQKRFFCRPMGNVDAVCWRLLLDRIMRQWRDPEAGSKVEAVLDCIHEAEHDLLRAIHSQGTQTIGQSGAFGRRYDQLWCEGKIDGPEMAEFLQDFGAWIQDAVGAAFDSYLAKLIGCRQELLALGLDEDLKCLGGSDAAWQGFGKLIGEHALPGLCTPPFRPTASEPEKPAPYERRY
jgi:hypothetical protein